MESFERRALEIMARYGGRLVVGIELSRDPTGGGEEVHVLEFPSKNALVSYQNDAELQGLAELRARGIRDTVVEHGLCFKRYDRAPE